MFGGFAYGVVLVELGQELGMLFTGQGGSLSSTSAQYSSKLMTSWLRYSYSFGENESGTLRKDKILRFDWPTLNFEIVADLHFLHKYERMGRQPFRIYPLTKFIKSKLILNKFYIFHLLWDAQLLVPQRWESSQSSTHLSAPSQVYSNICHGARS